MLKYKKGDKVIISKYYKNSFDSPFQEILLDDYILVEISNIINNKVNNPYLINVNSRNIGWCNDNCIIGTEEKYIIQKNKIYEHYIKEGETLVSIAYKYKTTYDKIAKDNNITDINKLKIGDKLIIR